MVFDMKASGKAAPYPNFIRVGDKVAVKSLRDLMEPPHR